MRIHIFMHTLDATTGGGSHYNALCYIRHLCAHGHEVIAHVFSERGNHFPEDVTPLVHQGTGMGILAKTRYLRELLNEYEHDADVFFLYGVDFVWGGGAYRRRGGKKPVVLYIDAYLASMGVTHAPTLSLKLYRWRRYLWDKTLGMANARHLDRFLPCSPYIGQVYQDFGFPEDRFTVLSNIVPPLAAPHAPVPHDGPVRILYIGRLTYDKGVDLLIDALSGIPKDLWTLSIVGDGDMRQEIEERVRKEELPVVMHGWVKQADLAPYYEDADLFAHSARWPDPAPRTIVDSLTFSLPVVVPDQGGAGWIGGESAVIYSMGNVGEFRAAVRKLIDDPALRKELGASGPARARYFAEEEAGARLVAMLEAVQ